MLAAGELDVTFGGDGVVNVPTTTNEQAWSLAIQPDGRYVVAGNRTGLYDTRMQILRIQPNGALDASFGAGGRVLTSLGDQSESSARAVAIQSDGKIVVAGYSYSPGTGYVIALTRHLANGALDAAFGGDGLVTTSIGSGASRAYAMLLQPDGKIVVAGEAYVDGASNMTIARYLPSGVLDSSFDSDGHTTLAFPFYMTSRAHSVALQEDGSIVVAGVATAGSTSSRFAVARLLSNGRLDTSFSGDGFASAEINSGTHQANGVLVQSDGRIVAAGIWNESSSQSHFALVRYNADGSYDTTFHNDGLATTSFAATKVGAVAIAQDSVGRLIVGGHAGSSHTQSMFALARYLPSGNLDRSFHGDGKLTTIVGPYFNTITGIQLQSDGRIVAAGSQNYYAGGGAGVALARYRVDDIPNPAPQDVFLVTPHVLEREGNGGSRIAVVDDSPAYEMKFELVAGAGDTDNADFAISGEMLVSRHRLDYEAKNFYSVRIKATDPFGNSLEKPLTMHVDNVNEAPALTQLGGFDTHYTEDDPPIPLFANSLDVSDPENNLAGGKVIISNLAGNDRVTILSTGTGAGQISVSGSNVGYEGIRIGIWSGSPGLPLTIDLNQNATNLAVAALLEAIHFHNVNRNTLAPRPRYLQIHLEDGLGEASRYLQTILISTRNDAPVLSGIGGTRAYARNAPGVLIAPSAGVGDVDSSDFSGGRLTVKIANGAHSANRIFIGGNFRLDASNQILLNGTIIGTLNLGGGRGTTNLEITFNANAYAPTIWQFMRSLRFRTVGLTNPGDRLIHFTLSDGDGGTSTTAAATMRVT